MFSRNEKQNVASSQAKLNNLLEDLGQSLNSYESTQGLNSASIQEDNFLRSTKPFTSINSTLEYIYNNSTQEVIPKDLIPDNFPANKSIYPPDIPVYTDSDLQTPYHSALTSTLPDNIQIPSLTDSPFLTPRQALIKGACSSQPTIKIHNNADPSLSNLLSIQNLDISSRPHEFNTMQSNQRNEVPSADISESTSVPNVNETAQGIDAMRKTFKKKGRIPKKIVKKEKVIKTPPEPRKTRAGTIVNYRGDTVTAPEPKEKKQKIPKRAKKPNVNIPDNEPSNSTSTKGRKKGKQISDKKESPNTPKGINPNTPKGISPNTSKGVKKEPLNKRATGRRGKKRTTDEVNDISLVQIDKTTTTNVETEDSRIKKLVQEKTSFLTKINLKELIPQWLDILPGEDKEELALLLPESDRQVQEGMPTTIKQDFGTSHLCEAASKWQQILSLGGLESNRTGEGVSSDTFKDDNYEKYWGDRLKKSEQQKPKPRGRPRKKSKNT